jgi:serine protease Do
MGKIIRNRSLRLFILLVGIANILFIQCSGWSESRPGYFQGEKNKQSVKSVSSEDNQALATRTDNINAADYIEQVRNAVFSIVASGESGMVKAMGFFISEKGIAVSNYHIFENINKSQVEIHLESGANLRIDKILARNSHEDYIVFKVDNQFRSFQFLPLALKESGIGDGIFAVGVSLEDEQILAEGVVSAYMSNRVFIETTLKVPFSCIGGPMLNSKGEVIGITIDSRNEDGQNFAVNSDLLQLDRFIRD